ncbi:MAG: hypothetical protein ACLPQ6_03335 [Steroidobacteraceae bacterium]|jgi:YD repeat-containing protein
MTTTRGLERTEYDADGRTLTLTYKDGHQTRIRNVSAAQAARLVVRADADARRSAHNGFSFHRS